MHHHTNLVYLACDGQVLLDKPLDEHPAEGSVDYGLLSVAGICDFADTVDLEDVRDILDRQIAYNTVVSDEGLRETTARTSARCCWMPTAGIYGPGPRRGLPRDRTRV